MSESNTNGVTSPDAAETKKKSIIEANTSSGGLARR